MDFGKEDSEDRAILDSAADWLRITDQLVRLERGQRDLQSDAESHQEVQVRLLESLVDRLTMLTVSPDGSATLRERLKEVEQDRDRLLEQLDELTERAAREEAARDEDRTSHATADLQAQEHTEEVSQLRRRLDLALEDLRDARREVETLREGSSPQIDVSDWESQKRSLLARLDDPSTVSRSRDSRADRDSGRSHPVEMQHVIDATDEALRRKEEEIEELQRLLQHQSENLGSFAVGAAAIENMLAGDELIQQERENLDRLQTQWRDKLKQAEIEISMERARIGWRRNCGTSRRDERNPANRCRGIVGSVVWG